VNLALCGVKFSVLGFSLHAFLYVFLYVVADWSFFLLIITPDQWQEIYEYTYSRITPSFIIVIFSFLTVKNDIVHALQVRRQCVKWELHPPCNFLFVFFLDLLHMLQNAHCVHVGYLLEPASDWLQALEN